MSNFKRFLNQMGTVNEAVEQDAIELLKMVNKQLQVNGSTYADLVAEIKDDPTFAKRVKTACLSFQRTLGLIDLN